MVVFFKTLLKFILETLEDVYSLIPTLDFFSDCVDSLKENEHISVLFVLA